MDNDFDLFDDVSKHLEQDQFRRKVILFQRSDNVLRALLNNLDEMRPEKDEEKAVYASFLEATRVIMASMEPFWPPQTNETMTRKLTLYEAKLRGERP